MWMRATELAAGDVVQVKDRRLHVLAVEHEVGTAVLTAEFDFLLHFTGRDVVDVHGASRPLTDVGSA